MAINSSDKWTVIAICLILGILLAFILMFWLERFRVIIKSNAHKHDPSDKRQIWLEKYYLFVRQIYTYLVTHKVILTLIAVPVVFAISIPFIGMQTPASSHGKQTTQVSTGNWSKNAVAARLGFLACGLYVTSYFFSIKNNPFALLLISSHEKMNYVHRRLSQYAIMIGAIHGFAYIGLAAQGKRALLTARVTIIGYVILGLMVIMIVSSLPFFRRRFYEWFFVLHHMCSIGFLITIWLHHRRCVVYMKVCVAVYVFDRGCRMLRSFLNRSKFDVVLVEDDLIYMKGPRPKKSFFGLPWGAGNHMYINIPSLSYWQIHPFTIASVPSDDFIELFVAVRAGFTKRLAKKVSSKSLSDVSDINISDEKIEKNGDVGIEVMERHSLSQEDLVFKSSAAKVSVLMDGPYGPVSNPYKDYSYLFLFAGGVGVSYILPIILDTIKKQSRTVHITFVWSARSSALLNIVHKSLCEAVRYTEMNINIFCHLTNSYPVEEVSSLNSQSARNYSLQYLNGRPDVNDYFKDFLHTTGTQTAALASCGSDKLLRHLKSCVNTHSPSTVDLYQHYEEI